MRELTFSKVLCCGRMEGRLCIDCMVYSQPFKSSRWKKDSVMWILIRFHLGPWIQTRKIVWVLTKNDAFFPLFMQFFFVFLSPKSSFFPPGGPPPPPDHSILHNKYPYKYTSSTRCRYRLTKMTRLKSFDVGVLIVTRFNTNRLNKTKNCELNE